jgi:hypothetical protein
MLLWSSSFRLPGLTNHQSLIGADYIHNSHSHVTGVLFPIAYRFFILLSLSLFFNPSLLMTIELNRCRFYVFGTAVVIQKHTVCILVISVVSYILGKIGN